MLGALTPIVHGVLLLAVLLLLGLGAAAHLVTRVDLERDPEAARTIEGWFARLPGLFAWCFLSVSLVRGVLQLLSFSEPGAPFDPDLARAVLLEGSWGTGWMIQSVGSFLLLALSWLLIRRPVAQRRTVMVFALALAWAEAGMGHGADDALWAPALGRAMHLGHLLGGGLWLGTLGVLALAVLPTLSTPSRQPILAEVVRAFSVPARSGAALLLVTGTVAFWMYTGALLAVPGTLWGRLLLLKLALLGGVAALGWHNWKRLTPALETGAPGASRQLRRAVAWELTLGFLVLAATAVMVGTALPIDGG